MTTPNAFRAESVRIPFASIEVRHATPRDLSFRCLLFIHDLRLLASEKRMGDFVALSRGVR